ncbi:transporter substrate-binding domain-containing protein [Fertoebacter nigrum]|uniref:Transporter substrate-binding domain-containing protein n=1 Tax=Fertoeibacter niger TaxID=2656921 RepID=A0A8X8GYH1_9RHOB|nr:transporter substrate-binding domain-containing protein [Fertoeibacter niger]NUB43525.1 transporter substrate-binding domain-containing protein [Fertoeibacter niger]
MRRRGLAGGLCALLLAGAVAAPALARCEDVVPGQRPQNTPREFVGQTMEEIEERGSISFAVYEEFPPYSFVQDGQPMGIDVGVGRFIADALGVEPEFRFVQAGENLQADLMTYVWRGSVLRDPVANVMLRVPYNSTFTCLVEQVVFTGQYGKEEIAIAYSLAAYPDAVVSDAPRHEGGPVPAFFRYDTVAVENDSIADFYLTAFPGGQIGPNIRRYPTMAAAMAALAAGEVMAAMGPRAQLQFGAADGVAVHQPPLPGFALGAWTVGLAVHHSHRDLAYAVDDAVTAALADGRMAALYAGYGLTFTPPDR